MSQIWQENLCQNKKYFFFSDQAFTPIPLLVVRPLVEDLFFAASLSYKFKSFLNKKTILLFIIVAKFFIIM